MELQRIFGYGCCSKASWGGRSRWGWRCCVMEVVDCIEAPLSTNSGDGEDGAMTAMKGREGGLSAGGCGWCWGAGMDLLVWEMVKVRKAGGPHRLPIFNSGHQQLPPYCHRHLPHAFPEQESAAGTEPKQTVIAAIRGPSLQQATSRPTPQQSQPSFHPTINSTPEPPQPPQPLYSATLAAVQPPAATSGQPRPTPDPSATPLPRASFPQQVTPPGVLCSSLQQSHAPSPLLCEEPPPSTPGSSQIPVPLAASPSVGKFSAQPPTPSLSPSPPINSGGTPPWYV
ncbi:extensin-like [Malania oleifera]|uniref:extensin-like n=1 Tax=Malania oleifera TaxID=397392 RepID=UPI0025AE87BC|nr:extensin-like [Malania oleifera]